MANNFANAIDSNIGAANSGQTNTFTITNPSNTASSQANEIINVGGGTAGDPFTTYTVTGVTSWSQGIDNSVSDSYKISVSAALGTSDVMIMDTSGNVQVAMKDFSVQRAAIATDVTAFVTNTDNTSGISNAEVIIQTGGSSGGDPYLLIQLSGGQGYSLGVDNSDSDKLKITPGVFTAGGDIWVMTSAGEHTLPLQSAFLATMTNNVLNVTGDGTVYTIAFDTEIFDQNADFSSTTYTAPVTSKVQFNASVYLFGGTIISSALFNIITSNRTYTQSGSTVYGQTTTTTQPQLSILADMDAADIATVTIQTTDSGGKVDDVVGTASSTTNYTYFSGSIIC